MKDVVIFPLIGSNLSRMPQISVIVPIYNAERTLHRCVDSILAQTFRDFELLLINDGSTDGSGRVCEMYNAKDCRVKVFHKRNGGQSSARNVGLEKASGKYVTFCDADDRFYANNLKDMVLSLRDSDCVIQSLRFNGVYRKEFRICQNRVIENPDFLREFLSYDLLILGAPWNKLYKKSIIDEAHLRFDENLVGCEDLVFCWNYFLLCKKISLSDKIGYEYLENLKSLSHTDFSVEKCECSQMALDCVATKMPTNLFDEFEHAYFWHDLDLIRRVYYSGGVDAKKRIEILGHIKRKIYRNHLLEVCAMKTKANKIIFFIVRCFHVNCVDLVLRALFFILKTIKR